MVTTLQKHMQILIDEAKSITPEGPCDISKAFYQLAVCTTPEFINAWVHIKQDLIGVGILKFVPTPSGLTLALRDDTGVRVSLTW